MEAVLPGTQMEDSPPRLLRTHTLQRCPRDRSPETGRQGVHGDVIYEDEITGDKCPPQGEEASQSCSIGYWNIPQPPNE